MTLREALFVRNMTGQDLADRVQAHRATVSLWVRGKVIPHPRTRAEVERVLGCVIAWRENK